MYLAQLFIPFLQFTEINITSFWSGGFTTPTAVNQRNGNLGNSIFVHFEMTFLTTLTGILDFAKLIFQTGIFSQFKLGKKSNWIFQTGVSKIPKIPLQIDRRSGLRPFKQYTKYLKGLSLDHQVPQYLSRRFYSGQTVHDDFCLILKL